MTLKLAWGKYYGQFSKFILNWSNENPTCEPSDNSDNITLPKLPFPRTFRNLKSFTPYFLNVGRALTGGSLKLHRDSLLLFASALSLSPGLEEPHPLSGLQGVPLPFVFRI